VAIDAIQKSRLEPKIWTKEFVEYCSMEDSSINKEDPWTKVLDSILGDIPILGMFSGYFPILASLPAMRLTKQPAFFEGRFKIDKLGEMMSREELNPFLSFMMLERRRG